MTDSSDLRLVEKLKALPVIELMSDWEKDIFAHAAEILQKIKAEGLSPDATFQHVVAVNQLSQVTHQGRYWIYVFSFAKNKSIRIDGDDLWLTENGTKRLPEAQKIVLANLLD